MSIFDSNSIMITYECKREWRPLLTYGVYLTTLTRFSSLFQQCLPHSLVISFRGEIPDTKDLLDKQDTITLKRCIYAAQRPHLPPIVTHNVDGDSTDPVLNHIRRVQLFNKRDDRVKVHLSLSKYFELL